MSGSSIVQRGPDRFACWQAASEGIDWPRPWFQRGPCLSEKRFSSKAALSPHPPTQAALFLLVASPLLRLFHSFIA